jgi:hypothetical protein
MNREEVERRVTEMIARRSALLEQIRSLANVRSVGVGLRIKGGNPTGELAYRVYVDIKVPRAALPAGDLIPESFEGVPIDVIQIGRARRACLDKGTRPILGGLEVAPSPFDTLTDHRGTLSCVVTTSDGKQAILSNEHVLHFKTNIDKRIWQPHYDSCLGFDCNKIGASVDGFEDHFDHGGILFWVDAAIAILDKGIGRRFQSRKIANSASGGVTDVKLPPGVEGGVSINSDRKVVSIQNEQGTAVDTTRIASPASALPGTLVWKIGNTTKLTAGVVDDAFGTVTDDRTGEVNSNLVLIRAVAGYEKNGRTEFADEGDSGSLLLDLSNHVIGLVTGIYINPKSDGSGEEHFVYACNIVPVLNRMKVSINVSPTPVAPTSGEVLREEAEQLEEVDLGERLHVIERRVRVTGPGPAMLGLIERHASEIYGLVTRVRAVTVVWHRNQGPAFAALFARTLRRGGPLPVEVNGIPLRSMLTAMAAVLRRHGSPSLSADLELHESRIVDLLDGCDDLDQMLSRLETRPQEVSR